MPPHSLPPELSIVVTSRTPRPFAVHFVQVPVVGEPLMHIDVSDGVAIRGPRDALTGLRTLGSVFT